MATVCAALLAAVTAVLVSDQFAMRRGMRNDLVVLAEIFGANNQAALTFDDARTSRELLAGLKAKQSIVSAAIYGPDGNIFATYHRAGVPDDAPLPAVQPDGIRFESNRLKLFSRIHFDGQRLGTIYL